MLVAENVPDLLAEVAKVLRALGHEVTTTLNGLDALCVIRGHEPFDLLILDIVMPGASGTDVLAALGDSHPPTIVMSGLEEAALTPDVRPKVRRFLAKPFDLSEFLAVLTDVLGTPQVYPVGPRQTSPGDDDGSSQASLESGDGPRADV